MSEPDNGIFDAMNKGLRLSRGAYVLFPNAGGSLATADTLRGLVEFLKTAGADIVYGDSLETDGEAAFAKPARHPRWNCYSLFTHHQAIVYRREALGMGYDLRYRFAGDWALTSCLLARSDSHVRRYPGQICRFARGGVSQGDCHRAEINREHWQILRREMGLPLAPALLLYMLKRLANGLRKLTPAAYDRLRFGRPDRSDGAAVSPEAPIFCDPARQGVTR